MLVSTFERTLIIAFINSFRRL